MGTGYRIASGLMVGLFLYVAYGAYVGFGLTSDAEAMARNRSVRGGSVHGRTYFGGGWVGAWFGG
jgi:hypothetical protein